MDHLDNFMIKIKQEVNERKDGSGAHNSMSHHASSGSVQVNREHLNQSQFYLIGDSTIKELTPIFSAAANVTVLWKEGLTYATLPKFAETHVNLDTAGQIYLVCFVGILDLIEIEEVPCSKFFSSEFARVSGSIPHCSHKKVSVRAWSSNELTENFLGKVLDMKQMIYDIFANSITVLIPDIQLVDAKSYQKNLDKLHKEKFSHEIMRPRSNELNQISMDVIADILTLNKFIERDFLSSVDGKFPWHLSERIQFRDITTEFIRYLPVQNGHILTGERVHQIASQITGLIDDYENPVKLFTRIYFVGDPRLNQLKSVWPSQSGIELCVIADGNLVPGMIAKRLKNEDKEILNSSLVIFCFSIKSQVVVQTVSECIGHAPCRYIIYKNDPAEVVRDSTLSMVEQICDDMNHHKIKCSLAFSPVIPIHFYNYRNVVAERHHLVTDHDPLFCFPGIKKSEKETHFMLKNASQTIHYLKDASNLFEIQVFDIPKCLKMGDNTEMGLKSCSNLVNGLSLTDEMASDIVFSVFRLMNMIRMKSTVAKGGKISLLHILKPKTPKFIDHKTASISEEQSLLQRHSYPSPRNESPPNMVNPQEHLQEKNEFASPKRHEKREVDYHTLSKQRSFSPSMHGYEPSTSMNPNKFELPPRRKYRSKKHGTSSPSSKSSMKDRSSRQYSSSIITSSSEDDIPSPSSVLTRAEKKEMDKTYDKHVKSYHVYVKDPSCHPAYNEWLSNLTPNKDVNHVVKLWERKVLELMNTEWQKKVVAFFLQNKKVRKRSHSSSSTDDTKRSHRRKKNKRSKSKSSSKDRSDKYQFKSSNNDAANDVALDSGPSTSNFISATSKNESIASSTSDTSTDSSGAEAMEIMKLLVQVRAKAGVVGETLPLLASRVRSSFTKGIKVLATFTYDDLVLLQLVRTKFLQTSRENAGNFVEKMIIEETVSQLDKLIVMINSFVKTDEPIFNMTTLNKITEHMNVVDSMSYIKKLLTEFNRSSKEANVLCVFVELVKMRGVVQNIIA